MKINYEVEMKFAKQFNSFEEGLKEITELSFSVHDSLTWAKGRLPKDECEATQFLAYNAIADRTTANGVDWGRCHLEVNSFGVSYRTTSGLVFGWETALGASQRDTFEGEFVFFIAHPMANEKQATPAGSSLRRACEEYGWEETSQFALSLQGATKFL